MCNSCTHYFWITCNSCRALQELHAILPCKNCTCNHGLSPWTAFVWFSWRWSRWRFLTPRPANEQRNMEPLGLKRIMGIPWPSKVVGEWQADREPRVLLWPSLRWTSHYCLTNLFRSGGHCSLRLFSLATVRRCSRKKSQRQTWYVKNEAFLSRLCNVFSTHIWIQRIGRLAVVAFSCWSAVKYHSFIHSIWLRLQPCLSYTTLCLAQLRDVFPEIIFITATRKCVKI